MILAGAAHLSRKEDVYTGGGACVSNLKTADLKIYQPSNKLYFFTPATYLFSVSC